MTTRTVMSGVEKRATIIELARVEKTAQKVARQNPVRAARALDTLWALRRRLSFGCRPLVEQVR